MLLGACRLRPKSGPFSRRAAAQSADRMRRGIERGGVGVTWKFGAACDGRPGDVTRPRNSDAEKERRRQVRGASCWLPSGSRTKCRATVCERSFRRRSAWGRPAQFLLLMVGPVAPANWPRFERHRQRADSSEGPGLPSLERPDPHFEDTSNGYDESDGLPVRTGAPHLAGLMYDAVTTVTQTTCRELSYIATLRDIRGRL